MLHADAELHHVVTLSSSFVSSFIVSGGSRKSAASQAVEEEETDNEISGESHLAVEPVATTYHCSYRVPV